MQAVHTGRYDKHIVFEVDHIFITDLVGGHIQVENHSWLKVCSLKTDNRD